MSSAMKTVKTIKSIARGIRKDGVLGLRNLGRYIHDPLGFLTRSHERGGDIAMLKMLGGTWVLLSHPEDLDRAFVKMHKHTKRDAYVVVLERALGKGLLTADGELWKKQRRLSSFAFTPKKIRTYADTMVDVTAQGIAGWTDDATIDLYEESSRITMEVVAQVLFGTGVRDEEVVQVREALEVMNEFFANSPEAILRLPAWVPTPRNYRMNAAVKKIDEIVYRFIEQRRKSNEQHDDLLGALIAATDDEGTRMSDEQLRDEVVTLFLAGHETTALALGHTFFLLSRHPEVLRRLQAEVDGVLRGGSPKLSDLDALPYLEQVLKESMRLFPPAWTTGREVAESFELSGVTLPKGAQLLMSQWVVHRDPRWWPNPEAFDPERWTPEQIKARPKFAYFPFGGGPRTCIGNHFAMMEAKLMLATILARWQLDLFPGEHLSLKPSVTLRPKKSVRVRLRERKLETREPARPSVMA